METKTPEVDLDALLDSIKAEVACAFPGLQTVDDYFRLQETLAVPAVGLEIANIEQDGTGDDGTEQFAAILSLSAYCIVSYKADYGTKAKRRAASLAGAVAALVKRHTWGCPVQLAIDISATPDVFPHRSGEFEAWRVDWKHECFLGKSVWDGDELPLPLQVYFASAPEIGAANVADYVLVDTIPAPTP